MPKGDIFDQVMAAPKNKGDLFDQATPPPQNMSAIPTMRAAPPVPLSSQIAAPIRQFVGPLVNAVNPIPGTQIDTNPAPGTWLANLENPAPSEMGTTRSRIGDILKSANTLENIVAPEAATLGLVGEGLPKAIGAIPSGERAGSTFKLLSKTIGQHSVPVTEGLSNSLMEIQKAADAGSSMPQAARKLIGRLTDPEKGPLTYDEARAFASNVGRISADEANRLTPNMKRLMGGLYDSLIKATSDTAENAGKLSDFQGAMNEYRRAAKIKSTAKSIGKVAGAGAGVGLGYYIAHRLLFDTLRDALGGGRF